MKACILATDLALFFPNKAKLANIVKENKFSWTEPEHRRLAMALCMTGSDLNSSSKPWLTQFSTSKLVYTEFHEQGDVEKMLGWKPIPLFDRDNYPEVASMQVSEQASLIIRITNDNTDFFRLGSSAASASRVTTCWPR